MKKKIVHVIESSAGGSLNYVLNICIHLDPSDWDITVIYSRRPETPKDLKDLFPKYVRLIEVPMKREISIKTDMGTLLKLRKLFTQLQPMVIHLHSSKAGVLGRLAAWGKETKVLYTPHGFSFFRKDITLIKRNIYWLVEKIIAMLSSGRFLVGSKEEYRQAKKLSSRDNANILYNSVDVPEKPKKIFADHNYYVTIGRITAAKNPKLILDIVDHVREKCPDAKFVWVGDGEDRHTLEQEAGKRGLEVTITGWLPSTEVKQWLMKCRVYIQASSWEGMPLSLLEAMAMARPVIASRIIAHTDVINHGVNGFLAKTAEEFANMIKNLLDDPVKAEIVGERAWNTVRTNYSNQKFMSELIQIYNQQFEKG